MRGVGTIISVMEELKGGRLIQSSTAAYRDPKDTFDFKSQAFVMLFKLITTPMTTSRRPPSW